MCSESSLKKLSQLMQYVNLNINSHSTKYFYVFANITNFYAITVYKFFIEAVSEMINI